MDVTIANMSFSGVAGDPPGEPFRICIHYDHPHTCTSPPAKGYPQRSCNGSLVCRRVLLGSCCTGYGRHGRIIHLYGVMRRRLMRHTSEVKKRTSIRIRSSDGIGWRENA